MVTFLYNRALAKQKELREQLGAERDSRRLAREERDNPISVVEKLRDNLRQRVEQEKDLTVRELLQTQLATTEEALTNILRDAVLDVPRVQYFYAESMRVLVPREIAREAQVPEPVRETAVLVESAGEATGVTPANAEGHFLRGNALYMGGRFQDAVAAYDLALEVHTREALPQEWAATLNNKGNSLRILEERQKGEASMGVLEAAIAAFDLALEVRTREALPQDWAMTLNNKGNSLRILEERQEGKRAWGCWRRPSRSTTGRWRYTPERPYPRTGPRP